MMLEADNEIAKKKEDQHASVHTLALPAMSNRDTISNMTDKPKRRRLQMHLSTAVLLMLASGVLLLINVRHAPRFTDRNDDFEKFLSHGGGLSGATPGFLLPQPPRDELASFVQGWPVVVYERLNEHDKLRIDYERVREDLGRPFTPIGEDEENSSVLPLPAPSPLYTRIWERVRTPASVALDVVCAIACLFFVWQTCEYVIRRREVTRRERNVPLRIC